jgi:hypothetical protein
MPLVLLVISWGTAWQWWRFSSWLLFTQLSPHWLMLRCSEGFFVDDDKIRKLPRSGSGIAKLRSQLKAQIRAKKVKRRTQLIGSCGKLSVSEMLADSGI